MISNKNNYIFTVLAASQVLSQLADRALLVGLSWYLVNHYSSDTLAWYLTISMLPHLVMTIFSGKIINKYSPVSIVRFSEFFRSILIGLLALVVYFGKSEFNLIAIIILTTGANFFAAMFNPALLTVPRQLELSSKNFQKITGLLSSCASVARMTGPILVLPIFSYTGVFGLILSCFILYFIAWLLEFFIHNPPWLISDQNKLSSNKRHYLYELVGENLLVFKVMALFFIINLVVVPIQLFMPLMVKDIFHAKLNILTVFESALGFGLLVGGILIVIYTLKIKMVYRIAIPYMLAAVSYIVFAFNNTSFEISAIMLFLFGFFLSIGNVITISFYQYITPIRYVAQIMVFINLISNASGPIAMIIVGVLLAKTGVTQVAFSYGICFFILSLLLLSIKSLQEIKND